MTEKKTATKRPRKPKPTQAVQFTVWAVNGGPLSDDVVTKVEEVLEKTLFELFNDGHRLLTQTTRG